MKKILIIGIMIISIVFLLGCVDDIGYIDVTPEEAKNLIYTSTDLVVIDVSPKYDEGHIPGSINYYVGDGSLDEAIPDLDKNLSYLVYCHVDSASILGSTTLVQAGFDPVYRLEGNYQAWIDAGFPVTGESGYADVTAPQAKDLVDNNTNIVVIDVSPFYDEGHIPGAVNYYIGDGSLDDAIPTLDIEKDYLVYCHVDSASINGAEKLIDAGFNPVYRLEGNFQAWVDAGYDVEP